MKSNTYALILGLVLSLCLIVGVEIFCYFLNRSQWQWAGIISVRKESVSGDAFRVSPKRAFELSSSYRQIPIVNSYPVKRRIGLRVLRDYGSDYWNFDPDNFQFPSPGRHRSFSTFKYAGKEIVAYDVVYTIDNFRRRWTPEPHNRDPSSKPMQQHALFLGGSFTFGEGLNDNETLPYYFSQASGYRAYNLGFHGYGPNDLLARLRKEAFWEGMTEPRGLAIYVFIDNHILRLLGSASVYSWARTKPYFIESADKTIVQRGSIAASRPITNLLYLLAGESEFLKFFKLDWPLVRLRDIEFFARIISEIKKEYQKYFRSQDFVLVFYPFNSFYSKFLIPYLEEEKINYLDYSRFQMDQRSNQRVYIEFDNHPNGEANQILGRQLAVDIQSNASVLVGQK